MDPSRTPVGRESSRLLSQNHCAAFLCAVIMLGYALYGFATGSLVIPLSSGTMTLTGGAALWASSGDLLLAAGIGSIPFWSRARRGVCVLGAFGMAAGGVLNWIGTLLQ